MIISGKNNMLGYFENDAKLKYKEWDGSSLENNSYEYHKELQALHVKKDSIGSKSTVNVLLGTYPIGTKIDYEIEVLNYSGAGCNIAFDYLKDNETGNIDYTLESIKTQNGDSFEVTKGSVIVTNNKPIIAIVGVFSQEVGDYAIRYIKFNVDSKRSFRYYNLFLDGENSRSLDIYSDDKCEVINEGSEITIKHGRPFSRVKRTVPILSISGSNDGRYQAKAKSQTNELFKFKIYDIVKNEYIQISEVWGKQIYISAVVIGIDE